MISEVIQVAIWVSLNWCSAIQNYSKVLTTWHFKHHWLPSSFSWAVSQPPNPPHCPSVVSRPYAPSRPAFHPITSGLSLTRVRINSFSPIVPHLSPYSFNWHLNTRTILSAGLDYITAPHQRLHWLPIIYKKNIPLLGQFSETLKSPSFLPSSLVINHAFIQILSATMTLAKSLKYSPQISYINTSPHSQ